VEKTISSCRLTAGALSERIEESLSLIHVSDFLPKCGPVAQLGARFHGMEEVVGSIPTRSTNYFKNALRVHFAKYIDKEVLHRLRERGIAPSWGA
jgi:hypothetical protein